ncbi:hypothetical protein SAMN05421749_102118 [Acinetobacter marinus]|uniref:Uncharacterized protein n=1 Tax=Acinetobacter marinus TaxID=281375 RepID=A0A1G6HDF1_9GAMM|nr:hypothetical protein [Acinetobacter marinus]SDB92241.1 hypothetical protein SAMN05421749_102118 [Acinetobacter marinus]
MALNVGENFTQRWLATPEAVRQTFSDELNHICDLLNSNEHITKWQYQDAVLQQKNKKIIERAYADLKQQILAEQARLAEQRKRQRQAELEQALAEKRALEAKQVAELEAQEQRQAQHQDAYLQQLAQELQQQSHTSNFDNQRKFDTQKIKQFNRSENHAVTSAVAEQHAPVPEITEHQDLRTRLELEAEFYIEQTLQQLKTKLQAAAQEEIELILSQQQDAK